MAFYLGKDPFANDVFTDPESLQVFSGTNAPFDRIIERIRNINTALNAHVDLLNEWAFDSSAGVSTVLESHATLILENRQNITIINGLLGSLGAYLTGQSFNNIVSKLQSLDTYNATNTTNITSLNNRANTLETSMTSFSVTVTQIQQQVQEIINLINEYQASNIQFLGNFQTLANLPPASGGQENGDMILRTSSPYTTFEAFVGKNSAWSQIMQSLTSLGRVTYPVNPATAPVPTGFGQILFVHGNASGTTGVNDVMGYVISGAHSPGDFMWMDGIIYFDKYVAAGVALPTFNATRGAVALVHHEYQAVSKSGLPSNPLSGDRAVITAGVDAGNWFFVGGEWLSTDSVFSYNMYIFDAGWKRSFDYVIQEGVQPGETIANALDLDTNIFKVTGNMLTITIPAPPSVNGNYRLNVNNGVYSWTTA